MGVTTRGYPYPDGVEPVNVPYDVQQLAEAVDADLAGDGIADTGWVDVTAAGTLAAGFTTGSAVARIKNGILEVRWSGTTVNAFTVPANGDTVNTTVFTFPAGYRPTDHSRSLAPNTTGPALGWCLNVDGTVQYVSGPGGLNVAAGQPLSCGGAVIL